MRIQALHSGFIMPTKGTHHAGAFDIYMPTAGFVNAQEISYGLGFATEIPVNHVALILPRSGVGSKRGLELNNTCGVIDSDYRGEWIAKLRTKNGEGYQWEAGDRILQFLIVPVISPVLELADTLTDTARGTGGFGSTGN